MARFISEELRLDLTPVFDQYLRRADERGFAITRTPLGKEAFEVATDLYYVTVVKQ
jgi:hypothetical protein